MAFGQNDTLYAVTGLFAFSASIMAMTQVRAPPLTPARNHVNKKRVPFS
jgi:hypothetical protein|tara:strand:- start:746 stop:892 length:147 start_codon:yes stop_codon:yes gene_type:complete